MNVLLVLLLAVTAAVAQVSVAPLFPVSAATFDFTLASSALLLVFSGPRVAMFALPLTAILLGFVTDRSPALLLVGYLPLLPVAAVLADLHVPINRYAQLLVAGLSTGLFVRLLLALAAVAHGAAFPPGVVVWQLFLPGLLLDFLLLTIVYFPLRFVGWDPKSMTLRRSGFAA